MALFLHETTSISAAPPRPRVSALAVWSLVIAISGLVTVFGFPIGAVLGTIALMRFRLMRDHGNTTLRGRGLAMAAVWLSLVALLIGFVSVAALLVIAYAQLPSPPARHIF